MNIDDIQAREKAARSEVFQHRCQMCGKDKRITVRIEHEFGEFGSILSSWPEFDVEPECLGFHGGDDDPCDLLRRVTEDMDLTETEASRARERCSFQYEEPWDNPDGAWVLGARQERGRQLKVAGQDIPYLLAELREAREKLDAVGAERDRLTERLKRGRTVDSTALMRDNLDRILKGGD